MDPLYLVRNKQVVAVIEAASPVDLANKVLEAVHLYDESHPGIFSAITMFTVNQYPPKNMESWAVPGVDKPATPHPAGWPLPRSQFILECSVPIDTNSDHLEPLPITGYNLNLFDLNGWAMPAFELPEFLHWYTRTHVNMDISVYMHDPSNHFCITIGNTTDEESETYEGQQYQTVDGPKLLFAVGAGYWCWEDLADDEPDNNPSLL